MDIAELGFRADSGQVKVALRDLDKLGDQAAITEGQVVKGGKSTEAAFKRTGTAAKAMGREVNRANDPVRGMVAASGKSSHSLRMMSMQMSQVAQQGAVTGNYLQALMVQIPDLALGFGAVGIAAGALVPVIYGVVSGLMSANEGAGSLEEGLTSLEGVTNKLDSAMSILELSTQELGEKYGEAALRVREYAEIEAQIAVSQAREALREQIGLMDDVAIAYTGLTDRVRDTRNALTRIERDFGLAGDQARLFQQALRDVSSGTLDQQRDALLDIRSILEDNNMTVADLPPEIAGAVAETIQLSNAMDQAAKFAEDVGAAAADSESQISNAADEAARLAKNLAMAARGQAIVDAAQNNPHFYDPRNEMGLSGETDPNRYGSYDSRNPMLDQFIGDVEAGIRDRAVADRRSSGGAGGSGSSEAQKLQNDRMREAERIFEQTRTAAERYNAELADLNELHKLGYLDADTFGRAIAQLDEEFQGAGWLDDVQSGIEGVSSALAQAAVNGENMGEALVGALRNVAAAMIETQIFNGLMSLAGGLFGMPVSMGSGGRLSFEGGGYTGGGARSGGMDGRGGFLAMLHPNETVVDHTKGQSAGGGVTVVQHLHLSMGATEAAQAEIAKAAPKIREAAEMGVMASMRRKPGGGF